MPIISLIRNNMYLCNNSINFINQTKKIMNTPNDLKYTKDHEWARLDGEFVYIGITDYAQGELGDIVFVDVNTEGEKLDAEEVFGTIEAVKTVSDLMLPIEGEVIELNPELEAHPEYVNEDPYGKGWIIKLAPANIEDLDSLLSADEYKAHIAQ